MTPNYKARNSRTRVKGFRITHTQFALLETPPHKEKAGAIIRVLLQLYFNKRIPGIDALIKAEEESVELIQASNLLKFRTMLQNQGKEKKKERENGNNASSI
jgi:hypothetical protein